MYWNCVNNMGYKFTAKFHIAPSEIHMSPYFYESLFEELQGGQWWHLFKNNSVRGMKIVIDEQESLFTLHGGGHTLTAKSLNESRWI